MKMLFKSCHGKKSTSHKCLITIKDSAKFINELPESKGLAVTMLKKQKGAPKKKVKCNNAILPRNPHNYPNNPNHAKAQANHDKWRTSGSNDDRASKRLRASMISSDNTNDEERALEEKLRQIRKSKKNATKK
ncbi:hypothetical protein DXG01_001533 [Tephrocybe rancida]|nr:hypothetical protein DXG01_001533 [Tephrocybe rancida]